MTASPRSSITSTAISPFADPVQRHPPSRSARPPCSRARKHPNAAKLWIEYALSPECVEPAAQNGSYQFLVIDNATQPSQAAEFGLDPDNVMEYDFEDAKNNTGTYVEEVMAALSKSGADTGADRFKTE